MIITLIIFYILISEGVFITLWLIDGRKKRILTLICSAPLLFPYFIVTYIRDLFNPIKGIFQANSVCFFSYKDKWEKDNPGKVFPVMIGLLMTTKSRYPNLSNSEVEQFIRENNVKNLISLVEAIIINERPDLIGKWVKFKTEFNEIK